MKCEKGLTGGVTTLCVLVLVMALGLSTAKAAPPSQLVQFCKKGPGAGQCNIPWGVGVDQTTGRMYIADELNQRVNEFSPWGVFLRSVGWGVASGAAEAQTCGPEGVPPSAACLEGSESEGAGGFKFPMGVTVDSAGNLYVFDWGNDRVQKFDPEGNVLLTFGGEVDKTTNANVCTAASGDECGAGVEGTAPGFFTQANATGSYIAVGPGNTIYVGDKERVQEFEANGSFLKSIPLPGKSVQSLAVDSSGNLYLGFAAESDVHKLSPTGTPLCTAEVKRPKAVAAGAGGNFYVVNRALNESGTTEENEAGVLEFNSSCGKVDLGVAEPGFGSSELTQPAGIATSQACGINGEDIIVPNADNSKSFVNLYGPPPNPSICPPPAVAPSIDSQFAASVDTSAATVKAKINPHFWKDTRFYVEYGTAPCSSGGCLKTPAPPGTLLGAEVGNDVTSPGVFLGALSPDTTYHYRFVAESSGGGPSFGIDPDGEGGEEADFEHGLEASFHTFAPRPQPKENCPNQSFRSEFSAPLPDCRAYEMVSPVDKNGGDIATGEASFALAGTAGNTATFSSYRSFAEPLGAPFSNQYLAERDPAGWLTRSISAPRESLSFYPTAGTASTIFFKAFSEDLCSGWVAQDNKIALAPGAPPDVPNLYRRNNCPAGGGSYELLSSVPPPGFGLEPLASGYYPEPEGASADSSRSVFRADAALTTDACTTPSGGKGVFQVYESLGAGALQLISVLPNGQPACTQTSAGTAQGLEGNFREDSLHNAVSSDGRRVFWTASNDATPYPAGGKGDQPGHLYLRENIGAEPALAGECNEAEAGRACTLEVSQLVSQNPARFWSANPEGTAAIFSVGEALYRFESDPSPQVTEIAQGFKGVLGASEDTTRVYFVSSEQLSGEEENSNGDKAVAGQPNLYLFEAGGPVRFAGTPTADDANSNSNGATLDNARPNLRSSRVSPSGEQALFMSRAPLTGFESTDAVSGQADAEVFLFDAEAGELICVSCNASGSAPAGREVFSNGAGLWASAQVPGWTEQLRATRLISADGRKVFFESFEALVTRDTNGAEDVYEWERAASKAQCEEAIGGELFLEASEGCLSLISSGQSPADSEVLDASANGSDVLISTAASLLPQDPGLIDVYDARAGGGFPPQPKPQVPCEGAACQSPPPPPNDPTPASAQFHGAGNPKPQKCAKGKHKVTKNGKTQCVKNKKGKKKPHKTGRAKR